MSPISDLASIKEKAVAEADETIAKATAERHQYLRARAFPGGEFNAAACNDAELEAISKNIGKKKSVPMVDEDGDRTGDQDLVDFVLTEHKKDADKIKAAIEKHAAFVAVQAPRVPSSAAHAR